MFTDQTIDHYEVELILNNKKRDSYTIHEFSNKKKAISFAKKKSKTKKFYEAHLIPVNPAGDYIGREYYENGKWKKY